LQNLILKGITGLSAYGYLLYQWGNVSGAEQMWSLSAQYAEVWLEYGWVSNAGAGSSPHAQMGYTPNYGPSTWGQLYNAMWLRLLGFDSVLPGQASIVAQELAFYETYQLNTYGLPLFSDADYTKGDWSNWVAAMAYTNSQ
jgi:hypothetical protein